MADEGKTGFKDLVNVIKNSPSLMITGVVILLVVGYLLIKNGAKNGPTDQSAAAGSTDPNIGQGQYHLLFEEESPATVNLTVGGTNVTTGGQTTTVTPPKPPAPPDHDPRPKKKPPKPTKPPIIIPPRVFPHPIPEPPIPLPRTGGNPPFVPVAHPGLPSTIPALHSTAPSGAVAAKTHILTGTLLNQQGGLLTRKPLF